MDHDLLEAPLLSFREPSGNRGKTSLPGLLARLASGDLADFPQLRTHQFHPWVMFVTQLAAIALHRAGQSDPRLSEKQWRELLLHLTRGQREPWCLVVEDLTKPAFFQPPVPAGSLDDWKTHVCPDDIDVLVTAKGHDVKASLLAGSDLEAWVYALVTLQTMQGYPGRGYTGIARMNGGYGSRARVGLTPGQALGARFQRDVAVLLATWPVLLDRGYRDGGVALVWLEPWDGQSSLGMGDLSPHFIEVCWRVRCELAIDGVHARYTTTGRRRCLPEVDNGDVGDPWVPIEREKGAVSVGRRGFHYDLLQRILLQDDFEAGASQAFRADDGDSMLLVAAALARGQGKTEGLHERALPLSAPVRRRLGSPDSRAALGRRASEQVNAAQTMRTKVLFPALKQLPSAGELRDGFDAKVDQTFFDQLFSSLDDSEEEARLAWLGMLRDIALREIEQAIRSCPVPSARRWAAASAAERMFWACLAKNFPDVVAGAQATREVPS